MANGGDVIFKFKADNSDLEKATGKAESALTTLAKSFTIANIASGAVNKGIQLISNNLGDAISRFDTMNNFPRVMENLGFATEDAQKAVNTLSDGLMGLPTALDESISSVQRLTASNGDIEKSTQIYLAMNDALLAGGGNAQMQASAMEQLTQAYSKGRFDAIEYRSVLSAMPGQLKQIAEHLGYTSTAIGGDLYEALQQGKLSMDDFMNAFVELDTNGTKGMASFKDQALSATGGIATSWKNLKTAVVRSITDSIKEMDKSLKSIGGISGAIKSLSGVISNVIKIIGKSITTLIKFKGLVVAIGTAFVAWKIGTTILKMIQSFQKARIALALFAMETKGASIMQGLLNGQLTLGQTAVALLTGKTSLATVATGLWSKAQAVLNGVMSANPIGAVLLGVTVLTGAIIGLYKATGMASEKDRENAKALEGLKSKMQETKEEYQRMKQAREENLNGIQSEFDYTQQLANELKTLADENGKVSEQNRARAEFILGELNNALGTEYKMNGNIIQGYRELSTEIDNLIEKKRAELMLEAYEEDYKKAIKSRNELSKQGVELHKRLTDAWVEYERTGSRASAENLNKALEAWNDYKENLAENTTTIMKYEEAQTAYLSGEISKVEGILSKGKEDYSGFIAHKLKETKELGGGIPEEMAKGMEKSSAKAETTASKIANALGYNLEHPVSFGNMMNLGSNIIRGIANGLAGGITTIANVASRVASTAVNTIKRKLGIHSPSTIFRDEVGKNIILGISEGFENEIGTLENDISSSMLGIIPDISATLGDLFDLSPTLNNTATSSSNVTVQVYNNMETDMMGNLINNIKTFSNGSKNDYNYGMA